MIHRAQSIIFFFPKQQSDFESGINNCASLPDNSAFLYSCFASLPQRSCLVLYVPTLLYYRGMDSGRIISIVSSTGFVLQFSWIFGCTLHNISIQQNPGTAISNIAFTFTIYTLSYHCADGFSFNQTTSWPADRINCVISVLLVYTIF